MNNKVKCKNFLEGSLRSRTSAESLYFVYIVLFPRTLVKIYSKKTAQHAPSNGNNNNNTT